MEKYSAGNTVAVIVTPNTYLFFIFYCREYAHNPLLHIRKKERVVVIFFIRRRQKITRGFSICNAPQKEEVGKEFGVFREKFSLFEFLWGADLVAWH
jgi:hypothetical protein